MSFFLYHTKVHRCIILFLDYALTCSQIIMLTLSPIQVLFIFTESRIRKGKHFSSHFKKIITCVPLRPETRKGCLFSSLLFDIVQEIIAKTMKQEKKWKASKMEEAKQSIFLENIVIYICVYVSVYICVCIYVSIHTHMHTHIYIIFLNLIYIKKQQQKLV